MFTYESINYAVGNDQNVSYNDCIMLRDMLDFKKDMKVAAIAISYELYGWLKHENSDCTSHDLYSSNIVDNSTS
jgi:hypothetical protein